MKIMFSFFFFLLSSHAFSQGKDSLGNSNSLNGQDAVFLNTALQNTRGDFNFENKQVAFITGSSGNIIVTRNEYFNQYAKPSDDKPVDRNIFMVVLSNEEKTESGGYDALVFTWVKVAYSDKQRRKIINKLKQQHTIAN